MTTLRDRVQYPAEVTMARSLCSETPSKKKEHSI